MEKHILKLAVSLLYTILVPSLFMITIGLGELDQAIDRLDRRIESKKDKKIDNREEK